MVLGSSPTQLLMALKALKPLCSAGASLPGDAPANETQAAPVASAEQGNVHAEMCGAHGAGQRLLQGELCKAMQTDQKTCTRALVSVAPWRQKAETCRGSSCYWPTNGGWGDKPKWNVGSDLQQEGVIISATLFSPTLLCTALGPLLLSLLLFISLLLLVVVLMAVFSITLVGK